MATIPCTTIQRNGHQTPTAIPQGPAMLPEARCSVNMRFQVQGYSDSAQATGRGDTPEEAARNLKATIDATREALAPTPRLTREERASQLLASGTLKAIQRGDFACVERLAKAFCLVVRGHVEPTDRTNEYAVRSQRDLNLWYAVDAGHCSCPDAAHHPDKACKHKMAVAFWKRLDEQEAAYV